MAATDGTFIFVATYPDEASARDDTRSSRNCTRGGLVGSYDAAVVTKDASGKVHETRTRQPPPRRLGGGSRPVRRSGSCSRRLSSARQLSAARSAR